MHRGLRRKGSGTLSANGTIRPFQCVPTESSLPSPAPEILEYLARHPDAQDTIDGILHWWLLDACIRKWASKIAETLDLLVQEGFLEMKRSDDGHVLYRVSPQYRMTLEQRRAGQPPS